MKLLRVRPIDLMIVLAIVGYAGWKTATRLPQADGPAQGATFAREIDLSPLHTTAVQADGRLRSFASHAKHYMAFVTGPRSFQGQSNGFTYLDLIFRPQRYTDADGIYIKNKLVRNQIIDALKGHPKVDGTRAETIRKSGLIARTLLDAPAVRALLDRLGRDLIRTGKAVDRINSSLAVTNPDFLLNQLRVVVPADANADSQWVAIAQFLGPQGMPVDAAHSSLAPNPVAGVHETLQKTIRSTWSSLRSAWRSEDVAASNEQIEKLAGLLNDSPSKLYPSSGRLGMESWYFRNKSMTWVWLVYLAAVVPLLMSVIYQWDGARKAGMAMFVIAFGFHTASLIIRWYISGRWPNSNMFEALTTSAWFGGTRVSRGD